MMETARRKSRRRAPRRASRSAAGKVLPRQGRDAKRKLIEFEPETWQALDLLARDSMKSLQELADEAFRDLLRKHGRTDDLRVALRKSAADPGARTRRVGGRASTE